MTKIEIEALPTRELTAIIRSTNPAGSRSLELAWAREEFERRTGLHVLSVRHFSAGARA